jgi:hypothetical protein
VVDDSGHTRINAVVMMRYIDVKQYGLPHAGSSVFTSANKAVLIHGVQLNGSFVYYKNLSNDIHFRYALTEIFSSLHGQVVQIKLALRINFTKVTSYSSIVLYCIGRYLGFRQGG